MDGFDLTYILEGIIELPDALSKKIQASVKYGKVCSKIW